MPCALIFSDSHGNPEKMEQAYRRQPLKPDVVFFLGDGLRDLGELSFFSMSKVIAVRGNCDWYSLGEDTPTEETVMFGGLKIFATHGHRYQAKCGEDALIYAAQERGADIVLFGHTHRQTERRIEIEGRNTPLFLFNPGSVGEGYFGTLEIRNGVPIFGHGQL